MDPTEADTGWEDVAPRSMMQQGRALVVIVIAVAVVAWSLTSSPSRLQPVEPGELGVETAFPQPVVFDHVSFLGNSLLIDDLPPDPAATYVAVQWGGGSIAVPFEPGRALDPAVYFVCDAEPVRLSSADADQPVAVLIAGAGVHSQLMGCRPTVPDVRLDSMGVAMWSLPLLIRLNSTGLVADLSTDRSGELEISLRGRTDGVWTFNVVPAFGGASRPPVGSTTVEVAGGEALQWQGTHYLHCDRSSIIIATEPTAALSRHLDMIGCVPSAPVRPRDPMEDLLAATQALVDSVTAGGVPMFDLESHRPVVRFTVAGPLGNVRMLSLVDVTAERVGDVVVQVTEGAVLHRRDGGTVAECQGVAMAIDPEYEPIAIPTLQTIARAAGCVLRTPTAAAL